jgi:hypothetical protein
VAGDFGSWKLKTLTLLYISRLYKIHYVFISSAGKETRYEVQFIAEVGTFFLSNTSRQTLGSTQPQLLTRVNATEGWGWPIKHGAPALPLYAFKDSYIGRQDFICR